MSDESDDDLLKRVTKKAAAKTDQKLAERAAKLTSMDEAQFLALFPEKTDAVKVEKLMQLVRSATDENQRAAELTKHVGEFGTVIVRLLKHFTTC